MFVFDRELMSTEREYCRHLVLTAQVCRNLFKYIFIWKLGQYTMVIVPLEHIDTRSQFCLLKLRVDFFQLSSTSICITYRKTVSTIGWKAFLNSKEDEFDNWCPCVLKAQSSYVVTLELISSTYHYFNASTIFLVCV